jgi:radical SAM superfamily enzyme YgiQ (UPF0313 family)
LMRQKTKHLLLINPWIYDFSAYDLWSKPLGLLYISSFLEQQGFKLTFIDCLNNNTLKAKKYGQGKFQRHPVEKPEILKHIPRQYARYGISEDEFKVRIKDTSPPDAILITTMMTYWYLGPKHVVSLLRELFPGVPIILGGVYASLLPEHASKEIKPDYLIEGPGELTVLKLLTDILDLPHNDISIFASPDNFPYPAFHLLDHLRYLVLLTSRGCPYECSFCAQKLISMPFTQRKPANVVEEIKTQYQNYHVRDIAFYDDALFLNKERHIKKILKQIIELRIPVRFHTPNGLFAGQIDADLARLMYQTAFRTIRLSYETINKNRQSEMSNKISNEAMIEAVQHLANAGYQKKNIEAYIIMGLPGQPPEEVLESMIFVNNLGIQIRLASYSPIHGTRDFARSVSEGLIDENIDPLLTNKSIFPLQPSGNHHIYHKLRLIQNLLNQAVFHEYSPFSDSFFMKAIKKVI